MPRAPRRYGYSNIYHVMIRGINKQKIFYDEGDYKKFIKEIDEYRNVTEYNLLAYCLMPNHVHLLIFDPEKKITQIMRGIEISYAMYFNKKYDRVGNVFQDRFKSKNVDNEGYLERVISYIHQNPEKANICKIDKYKWSSFCRYQRLSESIDYAKCFELLGYNEQSSKESLKKFIDFNMRKTYNYEEELECEFEAYLSNDDAYKMMNDILNDDGFFAQCKMEKKIRDQYICKFKKIKCINNGQIANFFNLQRKTISRIK